MPSRTLAFLLILTVTFAASAEEAENPLVRLEAALKNPGATGILISFVGAGTQAEAAGIAVGDIMLSYHGTPTPDIATLNEAKMAVGDATEIEVVLYRKSGEYTITLIPGSIGVNGAAVTKGKPAGELPPATEIRFDFSGLKGGGREAWYAFTLDGTNKVGFEHVTLKVAGGRLFLRREVAFDGGEQWGLNHFDVTAVVDIAPAVSAVATRFENPLTGWIGGGRRVAGSDAEGGRAIWVKKWPEIEESRTVLPGPVVPEYLVETLAELMPRVAGACYHFRPLAEGMGSIGLPAALVVKGQEEMEFGAGKVKVWRVEQHRLGGTMNGTYFISEDGRTLRSEYGGPVGILTTKEAALEGLHAELVPRSVR